MTQSRRQMLNLLAAGSAAAVSGSVVPNAFASDDSRSKPKPRIRVGQIGVGHAHANKLSVYRSSPDYEVVGIVEPNEERRKAAQNQSPYQDLTWMTQEQLLNQPDLQVVLVETEVRNLLDTADVCIDAGKHIHLDKPAGSSLQQYESLLKRAEARNLIVQMGYMYRYNPAVLLLRDLLRNGWLGEIFEVHTVMSKVVPAASRKALAEFSGGIMFELGCHITDLVVGILGEPSSVTSNVKRSTTADDGLADNIIALFDYPRASATVRSSAIEIDGGQRRHLTVCGTRGTFHIQPLDNPTVRMALAEVHDPWKRGYQDVTLPKYARYVGDAADMAAIVREEKACDFSYSHDLAVQRTVLKASGMLD